MAITVFVPVPMSAAPNVRRQAAVGGQPGDDRRDRVSLVAPLARGDAHARGHSAPAPFGRFRAASQPNARAPSARHCGRPLDV